MIHSMQMLHAISEAFQETVEEPCCYTLWSANQIYILNQFNMNGLKKKITL